MLRSCARKGYNLGKPMEQWATASYRTARRHLGAKGARERAIYGDRLEQILAGVPLHIMQLRMI